MNAFRIMYFVILFEHIVILQNRFLYRKNIHEHIRSHHKKDQKKLLKSLFLVFNTTGGMKFKFGIQVFFLNNIKP
jgi:hypothetical protein